MNVLSHAAIVGRFFKRVQLRIICSWLAVFGAVRGQVWGGVVYWRGRVVGGVGQQGLRGVEVEQGGGAKGGAFGKAMAGAGLAVGLPAEGKGGGALGGAGVSGFEQFKQAGHGAMPPVSRARRRVVVSPSWGRLQFPTVLRQRVVDGAEKGQSVLFMPLSKGA